MAHSLSVLSDILLSSLFIFAGTFLYTKFEPRARYWPVFWALALLMTCLFPLCVLISKSLAPYLPSLYTESLPFQAPLSAVELAATEFLRWPQATGFRVYDLIPKLLIILYGVGVLILSIRLIIGRVKAHSIIKTARPKVHRGGRIYWSTETLTSPFTLSPLGRPQHAKIIISSQYIDRLSKAEIDTIFLHEEAHIARRDDEIGLILRILLVIFWFNPVCHLFFEKWKQSAEIQCDEVVTRRIPPQMRRVYAETLVKSLHITADRVRQYPTASFSNPRLRNAKMRITYIMNGTTPIFKHVGHKLTLVATMAFMTVAGAVALSSTAAADPQMRVNDINFMLKGHLTAPYGQVSDPFNPGKYKTHTGIDVAAPLGTVIRAPSNGVILTATKLYEDTPAYGTVVIIQTENETLTTLSHLDSYFVTAGQTVTKGQKIALVGNTGKSTGPHVHIETLQKGERVDPMTVWPFKG